ncbi:hypothetical protein ACFU8W_28655 [Streptomyces sp. NPDC057565]|uniref:hypothetical protein n=1 Tax=Streptomyces sp. NPDC057565 TaxID=3346169 RepID=UPI0036CF562D
MSVDGMVFAGCAQQLAAPLARYGREAELRAWLDEDGEEYARTALARLLEERGRTEEAVVSAEDLMHFGMSGGVIAEAERLVCEGEPEKAIAHLRARPDGTRRLRAEDL